MPFKVLIGDVLYLDGDLLKGTVGAVAFNLISGFLEATLQDLGMLNEREFNRLRDELLSMGWENYPL